MKSNKSEGPKYTIGIDTSDEKNLCCVMFMTSNTMKPMIIFQKSSDDKKLFEEQVKQLSSLFNAKLVEEKNYVNPAVKNRGISPTAGGKFKPGVWYDFPSEGKNKTRNNVLGMALAVVISFTILFTFLSLYIKYIH